MTLNTIYQRAKKVNRKEVAVGVFMCFDVAFIVWMMLTL